MKPTCSLLISTYNWPSALELCLMSICAQSQLPDEVIICDDGSKENTKALIEMFSADFPVPLIHVWQPDEGFQLAKIRNKGFAKASASYMLQIDGDLILHPHFVRDHISFARKGYFTTGSRVLLSQESSENLIKHKSIDIRKYGGKDKNLLNGLHLPLLHGFLADKYKQKGKNRFYVKGCNMAFWKSDLLKVNGYNEAFTGWGREDSELAIRLINLGVKKRFLKFGGICYHLHHPESSREMEQVNIDRMNRAIDEKLTTASIGINQYIIPQPE